MTFEDWWGDEPAYGAITAREAWKAAQKAERERIKTIIYEATDGGWCNYELLIERIG